MVPFGSSTRVRTRVRTFGTMVEYIFIYSTKTAATQSTEVPVYIQAGKDTRRRHHTHSPATSVPRTLTV